MLVSWCLCVVVKMMAKTEMAALKMLHGTIFGRPGSDKEVRHKLRQFNGFPFDENAPEFRTRLSRLKQYALLPPPSLQFYL